MLVESLCKGRRNMKKILAAAVISVSFSPLGVLAQERTGDAAIGALSGAVVLGPVGAVAGAVVGYTAGPSISRSWRLRRSEPRYQERAAKRFTTITSDKGALIQRASAHGVAPQSASTPGSATKPTVTHTAAKEVSA